jgi:hypothetical protein
MGLRLSVIIPALNEAATLPLLLGDCRQVAVFRFSIDLPRPWKGFIEGGRRFGNGCSAFPTGIRGSWYGASRTKPPAGIPIFPVMEDIALVRRLCRRHRIERLPATLLTSGRRYRERGVLRTWLEHSVLLGLHVLGVSPDFLAVRRSGAAGRAP